MTQGRAAALADAVAESGYTSLVLDRLARQACQVTDAEQSALVIRDPATEGTAIAVAGYGVDDVIGSRLDATEGLTGQVLASGRPVVVSRRTGRGDSDARPGTRAAAPVGWDDRVRGALAAHSNEPLRCFGDRELSVLEDLAEVAAAALRHAERRWELQFSIRPLVVALAIAIDDRDSYTAGHSEAVMDLCCTLGERLGLGPVDLLELESAALLHDLGKIAVPEAITAKPGPLTEEEAAVVRGHPRWGADLLATVAGMEPVATIVRFHHERWDGGGYPDGLQGKQIPLASRIIAACDAYHAMTSDRPYRQALPPEEAIERLRGGARSQFDPELVECLVDTIRQRRKDDGHSECSDEATTKGAG